MDIASLLQGQILPPEDPGYVYGNVLPERHKPGGAWEPAVPGMVRGAVNDIGALLAAPRMALTGQMDDADMRAVAPHMANAMGTMGLGTSAPAGSLGMFAGPMARVANHAALERAMAQEQKLESLGIPVNSDTARNATRAETGWFRGPEGKWRFEIPDTDARLKTENMNPADQIDASGNPKGYHVNNTQENGFGHEVPTTVGDVLDHPQLFDAYPGLANRHLRQMPLMDQLAGTKGSFTSDTGTIHLGYSDPASQLSTLLHENQHAVQDAEGFAQGGASADFLPEGFQQNMKAATNLRDVHESAIRDLGANPFVVLSGHQRALRGQPLGYTEPDYMKVFNKDPNLITDYLTAAKAHTALRQQQGDAFQSYRMLAGEVESRLVQARHASGDYNTAPWAMPDTILGNGPMASNQGSPWIPYEDQIIKLGE